MKKILIADDEARFRNLVSEFLKKKGYEVIIACDGQEAINMFYTYDDISLFILDVMMPVIDGYSVCKKIRETSTAPVLILTAKSEEEDQIKAFESGADDYISKPFSLIILEARIKRLLERYEISTTSSDSSIIVHEGIKIDANSHIVTVNEEQIELTPKEFELLIYFYKNKDNVLTRTQILNAIWNYDYIGDERTVDTHIKNLRIKLKDEGKCIKTVRGYGYKFE